MTSPTRRPVHPRCAWTALLAVVGLVLAACGAGDVAEDPGPTGDRGEDTSGAAEPEEATVAVVATTSILGDIVANVVGDDGEVTIVMGPGVDPHVYEPSAADAAALRDADLVVANGLMLEENLLSALAAAEEEGVRVLAVAEHLDPIEFDRDGPHDRGHGHDDNGDDDHDHAHDDHDHGHDDDHAHDDHDHDHGPEDPHVWFDPVRMADAVRRIAAELAAVDTRLDPATWEARGEAYAQELLAVHAELEDLFGAIPDDRRRLVTNHDALGYLAQRYGFTVLGTVVPGSSTQAEANPQQFADLVETVEAAGVRAIFAENTDSTRLAEQLASEVVGRGDLDVEVVRIYTDALGEPGSGADTYVGLLRTTATLITDALGGGHG